MKHRNAFTILILLIILPILSWYYLKTGMEYRKEALSELNNDAPVLRYIDIDTSILSGRTSLVEINNQIDSKLRKQVFEQFKEAYTFQYVGEKTTDIVADNYVHSPIHIKNDSILDATYIAIDTKGKVRNIYRLTDKESIQEMVSQLSILLPWAPERDIKQKSTHGG